MLLYISSNENVGIFDFLSNDHGMVIKKLSGTFSLKQFVMHDMRSLNHYSYFAIDIKALKDSEEEIIEAIKAFKSMFTSRVIFYVESIESNESIIESLIEEGIYNIILADTVNSMKEEIKKVVSDMGISKREIKLKLSRMKGVVNSYIPEYSFNNKSTSIIITGASTKVGTTTMAINLCNYLSSIGARVCYVEANTNNHVNELPKVYSDMTVEEDSIIYNEVKYLTLNSNSDEEYDFIIYDMGVIEYKIINVIRNKCDVAILCATTKPYEIETYDKAIDILDDANFYTIFSFVEEMTKLKLFNKYRKVFFSKYTPDPFNGENNRLIWEQILDKYITKNTM